MNRLEVFQIEVASEVRQRHLREISAKIAAAPRRRHGFVLVLVAAVLLLPLAAVGAEDTLPGEVLYPLKRILEPVRALFDTEVVAENRVDELEIMVDRRIRRPEIDRPIREAEAAVATRDRPDLRLRLDALIERIEREPEAEPNPTTTSQPPTDTTTTATPRETTTTAPATTDSVNTDSPTTAPTRDSTRP